MRRTTILSVVLLVATMGLFAGCELFESGGKAVKFTAAAKNDLGTKTVYAPYTAGAAKQDIYWSDNDQIAIYSSDIAVANYPDAATTADQNHVSYALAVQSDKTEAKLKNIGDRGMQWTGTAPGANFYFDAVYPAITGTVETVGGNTLHRFAMNIPADQSSYYSSTSENPTDMSHAYMSAMQKVTSANSEVNLQFYPAFTAFEIELKNGDTAPGNANLTITKVAIKSDSQELSGDYFTRWSRATVSGQIPMFFGKVGNFGTEVSVTFPSASRPSIVAGDSNSSVHFTLLALPFDTAASDPFYESSSLSNLCLEVTYVVPGSDPAMEWSRKLELKRNGNFIEFTCCMKHRITGVAFKVGELWKLEVDGMVADWNSAENTTIQL